MNDHFTSGGARCTVVAACGTGKTRIGIEVATRVAAAGRVLVVVPTLELLRQTGQAYRAHGFRVHAACGLLGDTVNWPDEVRSTDPVDIAEWSRRNSDMVVLTTYQSLPTVAAAHRCGAKDWDLVVIDEAHRAAGATDRRWGLVNNDDEVPARLRLYMTATPRVFTTDDDAVSMNDESVFGPVVYRLTFAQAIALDLLAPYQVMVPVITDAEIRAFLDATPLARVGSVDLPREMVTAQIALARAINHYFYEDPDDGYRTGVWAENQRVLHRSGELPEQRRRRLDDIGFKWEGASAWTDRGARDQAWKHNMQLLRDFHAAHGHVNVPSGYRSPDGTQLGNWVSAVRQKRHKLSGDRVAALDALGFTWSVQGSN